MAGVGAAKLEVLPESLPVMIHGESELHKISMCNRGSVTATARLTMTCGRCTVEPSCVMVSPGATAVVTVGVRPGEEDVEFSDSLMIQSGHNKTMVPVSVHMKKPVSLVCDKPVINFGCVSSRSSVDVDKHFNICNDGTAPCTMSCRIRGIGGTASVFHIVAGAGPVVLSPGQAHRVCVRLNPHKMPAEGRLGAEVVLDSGASEVGCVPLVGFAGTGEVVLAEGTSRVILQPLSAGSSRYEGELLVQNCGDRAAFVCCEDAELELWPRRLVLAVGATRNIKISSASVISRVELTVYHGDECLRRLLQRALCKSPPSVERYHVLEESRHLIDFDVPFEGGDAVACLELPKEGSMTNHHTEGFYDQRVFFESLQRTTITVHCAESHRSTKRSSSQPRTQRQLYLETPTVKFEATRIGDRRGIKLRVCNGGTEQCVVDVQQPTDAFHTKHSRLTLRPRSFVMLPIEFVPQDQGSFSHDLRLTNVGDPSNTTICTLRGDAV